MGMFQGDGRGDRLREIIEVDGEQQVIDLVKKWCVGEESAGRRTGKATDPVRANPLGRHQNVLRFRRWG